MKFEGPISVMYASVVCGSIKFPFLVFETVLLHIGEKTFFISWHEGSQVDELKFRTLDFHEEVSNYYLFALFFW